MIKGALDANENMKPNDREMEILREYFPACFKDDDSFDIEHFREYLSGVIDVTRERR